MGSFLKKIGKKKNTGVGVQNILAKEDRRMRSLNAQAEAVVEGQQGEAYNHICNGVYNVMSIYNLHRLFGLTYNQIGKVHAKMRSINACVETGRVSYGDLENLIIRGTDPENWPIKWKDYAWPNHRFLDNFSVEPGANRQQVLKTLVHIKREEHIDAVMHAMELMYMVALHDVAGFGARRCKRFANHMRSIRLLTLDEFKMAFRQLCKYGIAPQNWEAKILLEEADLMLNDIINQTPAWVTAGK